MLVIRDLCLAYGTRTVLSNFFLELGPGSVGVIHGPNGSGKTSLLHAITGMIPEYLKAHISGSISLAEHDLRVIPLKEKFRWLWFSPSEIGKQFFFPTCEAELAFALENMGMDPASIRQKIDSALKRFGLFSELLQPPHTLSAGQQSLLQCAMAEALDPPLYLLDEPARGLSESSLNLLCEWLIDLKSRNKIVLGAEHHPRLVAMADQVFKLGLPETHDQD